MCVSLCHGGRVSCGCAAHSGPAPSWMCHWCCRQGKRSREAVTLYMFSNWKLLCRSARLCTVSLMLKANTGSMLSPSSRMALTSGGWGARCILLASHHLPLSALFSSNRVFNESYFGRWDAAEYQWNIYIHSCKVQLLWISHCRLLPRRIGKQVTFQAIKHPHTSPENYTSLRREQNSKETLRKDYQ